LCKSVTDPLQSGHDHVKRPNATAGRNQQATTYFAAENILNYGFKSSLNCAMYLIQSDVSCTAAYDHSHKGD
jgi:hypothetical protein